MHYIGLPMAMWHLFAGSFRRQLPAVFGWDENTAKGITARAKSAYRHILADVPAFERGDPFCINLISCAMLAAFILSMPRRPGVDELTEYYAAAMMTPAMKWYCRRSGKRKGTPRDIAGLEASARLRAGDRNPYSWTFAFLPYPDGSGYEARFTQCGICTLMKKLGLWNLTPALCRLDYTMSEAGGTTDFVRQYTIASGGPYCDCGYHLKNRSANKTHL